MYSGGISIITQADEPGRRLESLLCKNVRSVFSRTRERVRVSCANFPQLFRRPERNNNF